MQHQSFIIFSLGGTSWGVVAGFDGTLPANTLLGRGATAGPPEILVNTFAPLISPAFTTPNLGTPSAGILTNTTGLPLTTGVTGVLPIVNGGANISTYVATTGGQTIAGSKVFVNPVVIRGNNPGFWFDETDFGKGLFVVLDGGVLQLQRLNNVGGYEANNLFVNLATGVVGISGGVSSTSTTTGALVLGAGGGIGCPGNLYAGGSVINFAALPTSATGLAVGSLWRNGTVVNIV